MQILRFDYLDQMWGRILEPEIRSYRRFSFSAYYPIPKDGNLYVDQRLDIPYINSRLCLSVSQGTDTRVDDNMRNLGTLLKALVASGVVALYAENKDNFTEHGEPLDTEELPEELMRKTIDHMELDNRELKILLADAETMRFGDPMDRTYSLDDEGREFFHTDLVIPTQICPAFGVTPRINFGISSKAGLPPELPEGFDFQEFAELVYHSFLLMYDLKTLRGFRDDYAHSERIGAETKAASDPFHPLEKQETPDVIDGKVVRGSMLERVLDHFPSDETYAAITARYEQLMQSQAPTFQLLVDTLQQKGEGFFVPYEK